jgi:hypothetical protein
VGNFSIEEIFKATENFSPVNKIGEGGFGTVYKGRLRDGTLVAVKRAKKVHYHAFWLIMLWFICNNVRILLE